ncbi:high-affinity gluconate transporter [Corynebacterium glucuronolyticum]|nr:High-affinity gluconate transporter [Corynebacterium glucuronolyticum DSM 44120]SMB78364.1 high-affinity gluconate transporter [Corynebacterium glucuronolyticum]
MSPELHMVQNMHIMGVVLGIALMLVLNMKFKVNAMVSLLIAALTIGFLERMGPAELLETIQTGFGSTLGSLAIIVVFGAVIGKLMVDSGAATRLADTLIEKFGVGKVKVAMVIVGLVFGLAMFYEVAFIILAPLIIAVAVEAKVPFLKIAIPAVAATTTAHSLFPPQPGPVALVDAYGADTGMVYIYALIVAIPTVIITGWVLPRFLGYLDRPVPKLMRPDEDIPADQRPSFALSLFVPLIPAIVMISATITKAFISEDSAAYEWVSFIGSLMTATSISPYIMAWAITVLIRLATGQGVVSAMTATGIISAALMDPVTGTITAANPALLVVATAAGSNTFTHVNDASFWLFKGYFDLSVKDTLKTWGLLQLCNSIVGLVVVMGISVFV